MIREADVDGDGQINYEGMSRCLCVFISGFLIHFLSISSFIEFVKVCVPVPCLIDRSLLAYSLDDAVEVRNVSMQFSLGFRRVYGIYIPKTLYTNNEYSRTILIHIRALRMPASSASPASARWGAAPSLMGQTRWNCGPQHS